MKNKKAFTLAETLIVLVILGIVASITIPPLVRRQIEAANRVKIKKAMGVYETMLAKITVENDIKSNTALKEWGDEGGECANQRTYFKAVKGEGCQFMTTDKVWWDVTDITHPKIALKEGELGTDSKTTFQLLGHFGDNGELRVDDIQWEISSNDDLKDEEKEELEKLYAFLKNKEKEKNYEVTAGPTLVEAKIVDGKLFTGLDENENIYYKNGLPINGKYDIEVTPEIVTVFLPNGEQQSVLTHNLIKIPVESTNGLMYQNGKLANATIDGIKYINGIATLSPPEPILEPAE